MTTDRALRSEFCVPMLLLALCLGGCGTKKAASPPPTVGPATIGAEGGTVTGPDGVTLSIPANSVAADTTFEIKREAAGAPELLGMTLLSPLYAITPHGATFDGDALLTLPFAASKVPTGAKAVVLRGEPDGSWHVQPLTTSAPGKATIDVSTLSWYAIGVCTPGDAGAFGFGIGDCPANTELKLEVLDGSGTAIPIQRDALGFTVPISPDITTDTNVALRLRWSRPANVDRIDSISLFYYGVSRPLGLILEDANTQFFEKTVRFDIKPRLTPGAGRPSGVRARTIASVVYCFVGFIVGRGPDQHVCWSFDTDVVFRVRDTYPPPFPPVITRQPVDLGIPAGHDASFHVEATTDDPLATVSVAWERLGAGGQWSRVPGSFGQTLSFACDASRDDGASFRAQVCALRVSDTSTCVVSDVARLGCTGVGVPVQFVAQPADATAAAGASASFTAAALGLPAPAVRLVATSPDGATKRQDCPYRYGAPNNTTTCTLTLDAVTAADSGTQVQAEASSTLLPGVVQRSRVATLTVVTPAAPVFVTSPSNVTVIAGQPASFSAVADGTPGPEIRWQVAPAGTTNFADVTGETGCAPTPAPGRGTRTTSGCIIAQTPAGNTGAQVRAVASNAAGAVASNPATLTVTSAAVGPTITQQPTSQQAFVGGSASFTVVATGTAPLIYAWRVNGLALPPNGGAFTRGGCTGTSSPTAPTVTLTGVSAGCDQVSVDVQVANVVATVTSAAMLLTVVPAARSLSLLAGEIGGPGALDGTGTQARVSAPDSGGMAVDSSGAGYFVDVGGTIRTVSTAGVVTTLPAVSGAVPISLAADASGKVYVAETGNVRRISLVNRDGSRTALAGGATSGQQDGPGAQATFIGPSGLASGPSGELYVVDQDFVHDARVRKITSAGVVSTFYDFGTPTASAGSLAVTPSGEVYGTGAGSLANTVVRITSAGVTVIAGSPNQFGLEDGTGGAARFGFNLAIAADASGNFLVTDANYKRIRRVAPGGVVTTVSGTPGSYLGPGVDGPPGTARWVYPNSVAFAPSGSFLVGDVATLRWLSSSFVTSTFAGKNLERVTVDGAGASARFYNPGALALDPAGNAYMVSVGALRKVTPSGDVSSLPGTAGFQEIVRDPTGFLVAATSSAVYRVASDGTRTLLAGDPNTSGTVDGQGSSARFGSIRGLAIDGAGNVFVSQPSENVIRRVAPDGTVITYAGTLSQPGALDGPRLGATFNGPAGLAVDGNGNLYVADSGNQTIRRISSAGDVSTVAGKAQNAGSDDGSGAAVRFTYPVRLALDPSGALIIADTNNFTLRRMAPDGTVTTVLGHVGQRAVVLGNDPQLNVVSGLAVRPDGTVVLTSEGALLEAVLP